MIIGTSDSPSSISDQGCGSMAFFVGGQGFQPFNPSYLPHSQKS